MGDAQLKFALPHSLVLGLLLCTGSVHAEDALDEVVVTGEQPGPGLWQVKSGANTLWILGTHAPLPKKMQWRAHEVEAVIAHSQAVIAPPEVSAGIGLFSGLRLLPAMLRARSIPDDGTLKGVLPADLYERWTVLAARYSLPDKIEHWRPALAAFILYAKALDAAQLNNKDVVWPVVEKAARRNDVQIRRSEVALQVKDPKGLINDYARSDITAETRCFEGLVARVEHDMPLLQRQANAWATGDIEPLRKLSTDSPEQRCVDVLTGTPRLASMLEEAKRKFRLEMLLAMEGALQRNSGTLAVVSVGELMAADGVLHELRLRGYQIVEPR